MNHTILLLIEHEENRNLLSQWLAGQYRVLLPEAKCDFANRGEQLLTQPFDLCFVDFSSIQQLRQQILARRKKAVPVFLPFVFLTNLQNIGISTDHLESVIDDVIHIPVAKIELQTKLRVLMRSRSDSLQLQQAKEEVDRALSQEKELNRLKSHFVSVVSHEFRNPLNSISGMAQILKTYGDKLTPEKKVEVFEQLQRNVTKMTDLLEDVLVVSRKDLDKFEFKTAPLELPAFCQSLIREIQTVFDREIQINFVYRAERRQFDLDRHLIERILSNLLTNACKYSPPDSVVEFQVYCQASEVVFVIGDRGIGIPAEDLDNLFEPFYRASNSHQVRGTGLGLSIVKQCVDLHQGKINVESKLGEGTTFTISFPC
ncbi:HAMP domain-containing sensor histidine kinase [Myxosarcina sp. GI1]|uniref:ATP-binding response regulator n=1 Tax=Myxosarcina sp. GI1 TaxID=1541065 RepID=UPI00055AD224|nr:HAMP domain-containing sensor histidine kinase [Myxosarcina sp. GI1]